ncbi:glycosyltransferase family 9 protein [Mucilaginibacter arboris]|uniref:LPS biosynthesis glycosyltransferase n=1 Tax=Mucilaginibacter arboris TaxID=2682090 RepID=A0A7K1T0X4_9SPHI|nr:glycosyltransferase family 9 protein [Mucilaginibacter arboris]MVN23187.1 LPS biosynthesis glycosyltransferase [Mucilaginibacter arboris]
MLSAHPIQKIVIFRALQLGDMLCSVPAFRALRTAYPDAHITLVGLPWAESLIDRFPEYFNAFIAFPGYPGLPEQEVNPEKIISFLQEMQHEKFDLALQMQGNGSIVNPMVELFGAFYTAGFYREEDFRPSSLYLKYPEGIHEIHRHLLLMNHLGIPSVGQELEFPLNSYDYDAFDQLNLQIIPQKYICIHPGSRSVARQWPPAYFAALADYCQEQGFDVVITGTKDEEHLAAEVMQNMKHEAYNMAGKTTLGALAVMIKNSYALIANCTGVSHIAAAYGTPSIIISLHGEPERWSPLNQMKHRTIDWTRTPNFNLVREQLTEVVL